MFSEIMYIEANENHIKKGENSMFKLAAPSIILGLILLPFCAPLLLIGLKVLVPVCVVSVIGLLLSKCGG